MHKRILIIEDTVNDLPYYAPLFDDTREVSFLFLSRKEDFTKEKLENLTELVSEELFKKIKKFYVCNEHTIIDFLKEHTFDFYIIDSLLGFGQTLIESTPLPTKSFAFFTSTYSFKIAMEEKGYPAYKKSESEKLIAELLT
jgi:hypothetical protein